MCEKILLFPLMEKERKKQDYQRLHAQGKTDTERSFKIIKKFSNSFLVSAGNVFLRKFEFVI